MNACTDRMIEIREQSLQVLTLEGPGPATCFICCELLAHTCAKRQVNCLERVVHTTLPSHTAFTNKVVCETFIETLTTKVCALSCE